MFVIRRTPNPQADLVRGWSAWNGQYEAHPFSLAAVDAALCAVDSDVIDEYNADNDCDVSEDAAAAAEFCREALDIDVQRCTTTGLYAVRHHAGLSSYELAATDIDSAIAEARDAKHNFATGGCCAIEPTAFRLLHDDIYVFECESIEAQHDS